MICSKSSGDTYTLKGLSGEDLLILQELFCTQYHLAPKGMKDFRSKMRCWHLAVDPLIEHFLKEKQLTNNQK